MYNREWKGLAHELGSWGQLHYMKLGCLTQCWLLEKASPEAFPFPGNMTRINAPQIKKETLSGTWSDQKRHERRPWLSGTALQLQEAGFNSKLPRASRDQEQLPGAVLPIYKPKEQSSFNALLQDPVYYNLSSKRWFCLFLPEEDWLATAAVFYQIFLNTHCIYV